MDFDLLIGACTGDETTKKQKAKKTPILIINLPVWTG